MWAVEAVTPRIQGEAKGRPFLQQPEASGEEHMFKTVLWATDGSAAAERALPVATSVAQTYGAKLIVVHAGIQASEIPLTAPAADAAAQESADATRRSPATKGRGPEAGWRYGRIRLDRNNDGRSGLRDRWIRPRHRR